MMMPKKQLLAKKCTGQMAIDGDIKVINAKVKFPMKMKFFVMVLHYLHAALDAPPSSLMIQLRVQSEDNRRRRNRGVFFGL
jgi:hypothetical protein